MKKIIDREERPKADLRFWRVMTFYERFEEVVVQILGLLIAIIIGIALWHLVRETMWALMEGALNPLEHKTFQGLFGTIMTLMIALEFKHSIIKVVNRKSHIIQVRTVLMIALLALARKFIILDLKTTPALEIFALGFTILALGAAHWLIKQGDSLKNENEVEEPEALH